MTTAAAATAPARASRAACGGPPTCRGRCRAPPAEPPLGRSGPCAHRRCCHGACWLKALLLEDALLKAVLLKAVLLKALLLKDALLKALLKAVLLKAQR